jgi:hypothetical protein
LLSDRSASYADASCSSFRRGRRRGRGLFLPHADRRAGRLRGGGRRVGRLVLAQALDEPGHELVLRGVAALARGERAVGRELEVAQRERRRRLDVGPALERPRFLLLQERRERALHLVEDALGDDAMARLALERDAPHRARHEQRQRYGQRQREQDDRDTERPHGSADEAVAFAPHGLDRLRLAGADLLSELRDVHVDGARLDAVGVLEAPDVGEEPAAAHDAAPARARRARAARPRAPRARR